MNVVVADIQEDALSQAAHALKPICTNLLPVRTDVSRIEDVNALAKKTLETYGGVELLFNNAGVGMLGSIAGRTLADWRWVVGVNLWGVIHGICVFLPVLLKQEAESHIINTASMAGLHSPPGSGLYNVTKHGIVSLSETLYQEMARKGSKVKVSVLCPGLVDTHIPDSERNRPPDMQNGEPGTNETAKSQGPGKLIEGNKMSSREVADYTFQAIIDEKFYIFTHPEEKYRYPTTNGGHYDGTQSDEPLLKSLSIGQTQPCLDYLSFTTRRHSKV